MEVERFKWVLVAFGLGLWLLGIARPALAKEPPCYAGDTYDVHILCNNCDNEHVWLSFDGAGKLVGWEGGLFNYFCPIVRESTGKKAYNAKFNCDGDPKAKADTVLSLRFSDCTYCKKEPLNPAECCAILKGKYVYKYPGGPTKCDLMGIRIGP